jgi:hypothetical protein
MHPWHPSPTPPHREEGLNCRALGGRIEAAEGVEVSHVLRQRGSVSPSPLWGGVGEGYAIRTNLTGPTP